MVAAAAARLPRPGQIPGSRVENNPAPQAQRLEPRPPFGAHARTHAAWAEPRLPAPSEDNAPRSPRRPGGRAPGMSAGTWRVRPPDPCDPAESLYTWETEAQREPAAMAECGVDEPSSRTGSSDGEDQVSEDRSLLHQRLAVRELMDTEVSYVHMLRLCALDIRSRLQQLPQGDLDILFSNINDIIKVNSKLLADLQETASREEEQVHLIGNLFLEFQEELERVYKVYCASYDQALLLVDTYRKEPELQQEIQGIIEAVVPQAGPSGLSFLLVIPLQRITKYPLLLQKILENTLPDARAYPVLQGAASALRDVNTNINEYKMRKEVASKYTKVEQLTLRERLSRINTHTLSKKTTRLSQLLKQEAGLVPRTENKEFDDLEERFHCVSLCVTEMKNNVAVYLDNLELPHHHVSEPAFKKLVEDALGQAGQQLRSFQENFETVLPPPTTQPLLPGSERQVQSLLSRYGPGKLYQVTSSTSGAGTLDLTLPRGQIVVLLQNKDTKGNSSRWLVDTGGCRGYVPARKLELYQVFLSKEELRGQVEPGKNSQCLTPEPTPVPVSSVLTVTQVVAMYPFVARSSHEVSLQAGQPVTVLEAQDKKGNPEWSLVEVNGQRGYVPSGFLARSPGPAPWGWSLPS
ncbi:rho guanine nucleotide exchange factor 37 isoform X2 [Manis pentadactyla]|uniref:rho guanine nucleotide exchange factor 37 isoform X2 n=1 Tax=Manis pentadactyla TaxID=143292 RepID=UPI00255D0F41|nr:rho guanine nucleotide exchange factor 37 isoform X2 [Manis pentadactyla]